jgi:hypothetical protein
MLLWKVEPFFTLLNISTMKKILFTISALLVCSVGSLTLLVGGALTGNPLLIGAGIALVFLTCSAVVGSTRLQAPV